VWASQVTLQVITVIPAFIVKKMKEEARLSRRLMSVGYRTGERFRVFKVENALLEHAIIRSTMNEL